MLKTKIKKAIAIASLAGIAATNLSSVYATNIGTATVTGAPWLTQNIVWDNNFPGTASGSVTGVTVTAQVLPTLNMTLSTSTINLGTLVAGNPASGNVNIEVGTNAADGVTITARSGSG